MEQVCVIGLGYIGLPTASLLATKGFTVRGVDVNEKAVTMINRGEIHIYEPDLDILVKAAVQSRHLTASTKPEPADVFILAVPTPFTEGHVPDLTYVEAATRSIAPHVAPGNLVILESTSPVGTTEKIGDWLRELRPDLDIPRPHYTANVAGTESQQASTQTAERIFIAHCPERVLPGQILRELVENDRIIGGIDPASAEKANQFYGQFVNGDIFLTNARSAELAKLSENAFRDVNIAFANELSLICDELDINVWELIQLANRHPRVNILQPGPGVGGHCIAVDPWFIVHSAPDRARLIRTAREVNDSKPHHVIDQVKQKAERFKRPVIACLGLAFKADVDDLRESPSLDIVLELAAANTGPLLVVEPYIQALPASLADFEHVELVDLDRAVAEADILVILVNHRPFAALGYEQFREKVIIDTRGTFQDRRSIFTRDRRSADSWFDTSDRRSTERRDRRSPR